MNPSVTPIKTKWHNRDEFLTGANISDVAVVSVVLSKALTSIAAMGNDHARPLYSKAYRTTALPQSR